jgi:hypothetical protein
MPFLPAHLLEHIALETGTPAHAASLALACGHAAVLSDPHFVGSMFARFTDGCNLASSNPDWSDAQSATAVTIAVRERAGPYRSWPPRLRDRLLAIIARACARDHSECLAACSGVLHSACSPNNALLVCCENGSARCAKLLIDVFGANPDAGQGQALWKALQCSGTDGKVVQLLLERGAKMHMSLHAAAAASDVDHVSFLMRACVTSVTSVTCDANARLYMVDALCCACSNGCDEVVRAMLRTDATLGNDGCALLCACHYNNPVTVRTLFDSGITVSHRALMTAVMTAFRMGHFQVVDGLLDTWLTHKQAHQLSLLL